jgi:hypothetical protein
MYYKVVMYISHEKPLCSVCRDEFLKRQTQWRYPLNAVEPPVHDMTRKVTDYVYKLTSFSPNSSWTWPFIILAFFQFQFEHAQKLFSINLFCNCIALMSVLVNEFQVEYHAVNRDKLSNTCSSLFSFASSSPNRQFRYKLYIYIYLFIVTCNWAMSGGSVYKEKVHEHPQYNTVHIYKYNTSTWTLQNTRNRKYMKTHNTWKNAYIKNTGNYW